MAEYDEKIVRASGLRKALRGWMSNIRRVAYTGSYDDLVDKPEAMTEAEAAELASDVGSGLVNFTVHCAYDTGEYLESGFPVTAAKSAVYQTGTVPLDSYVELPSPSCAGAFPPYWNTASNGRGDSLPAVISGAEITRLCRESGGSYHIYGQRGTHRWTVFFDSQGGSRQISPYTGLGVKSKLSTTVLPHVARAGYEFDGWYTKKNGAGLKAEPSSTIADLLGAAAANPPCSMVLYANWVEKGDA